MNQGYSERIHVTNHNSEWRNCVYAPPLQMVTTIEITRSKVIGQPINPFVSIAEDFASFIGSYSDYFTVSTRSVVTQAEQYLYGLMQSDKRNMERMAEVVPDSDEQSVRNLILNYPWSARAILNPVGIASGFAFWRRSGHLYDH